MEMYVRVKCGWVGVAPSVRGRVAVVVVLVVLVWLLGGSPGLVLPALGR